MQTCLAWLCYYSKAACTHQRDHAKAAPPGRLLLQALRCAALVALLGRQVPMEQGMYARLPCICWQLAAAAQRM